MLEVSLTPKGIRKSIMYYETLYKKLTSLEFMQYIGMKAKQVIEKETSINLNEDIDNKYSHEYRNNHQLEVNTSEIVLFNNSKVDLSNLSDKTKANYADGLSLAKIVEYGTGIVGRNSEASKYAENWEYDVNNHGEKGWFYENNGRLYWTKGIEGRLIYLKSKKIIENNITAWTKQYIKEKIESEVQ